MAFTVAFVSIANPYVIEDDGAHPLHAPIWAMLGSYDLDEVHDWNESIGKPMMWVYLVVSQVVLVNLLIAMMGNTFSEVYADADREWKFTRLRSAIEVTERFAALPPPLNLPLTAYTLSTYLRQRAFYPAAAKQWRTFGAAKMSMNSAAKDEEALEMKEGKKIKARVALKLKLALKRQEEKEQSLSLETISDTLHKGMDEEKETGMALTNRLERMERILDGLSNKASKSVFGGSSTRGKTTPGKAEVEA